jgi:hypothetical protein
MIATYQKTSTLILLFGINKLPSKIVSLFFGMALALTSAQAADNPILAEGYPERYTVVQGDTLWDISNKFLRDPWRWAEVWQGNHEVENPDLIYPGDVLVMTFVGGKPSLRSLVKLSPSVRITDHADAITPIDPGAIQAYINSPLVTDQKELANAGYIVEGLDKHLILGKYDQFYARAIEDQAADEYRVFRPGRNFVDPISEESLGFEAKHVGDARMLRAGDPSRLSLLDTYQEVAIKDRLRPIYKKEALPFFYPKAPANIDLRGVILETENKATELGALSVVALNIGAREGVEPGVVFRIMTQSVEKKDPVTGESYSLPEEKSGLLLVFRTFEKVSYAIISKASRPIKSFDAVVSPNL